MSIKTITVTPKHDCKACMGGGMLPGDSVPVPFGSGFTHGPDEYCDCVIEQLADDEDDPDIVLRIDDKVTERWEAQAKREAEVLARMEGDEQC